MSVDRTTQYLNLRLSCEYVLDDPLLADAHVYSETLERHYSRAVGTRRQVIGTAESDIIDLK